MHTQLDLHPSTHRYNIAVSISSMAMAMTLPNIFIIHKYIHASSKRTPLI